VERPSIEAIEDGEAALRADRSRVQPVWRLPRTGIVRAVEENDDMSFNPRWAPSRALSLAAGLSLLCLAGCSRRLTGDQAVDRALAAAGQHRLTVYPLAGTITVDGAPPNLKKGEVIVVMLNDPAKPDLPLEKRPHVQVGRPGKFAFHTYEARDGIPPGTFIVTFAQLEMDRKKGYVGPDRLHNLFNDAERNLKEYAEFRIEHEAPGKTDYAFDLVTVGRPTADASPHALTKLGF
jgi:hypothetical protein